MKAKLASGTLVAVVTALALLPPNALAFKVISEAGSGAGQTSQPLGLAVDAESGRLYVADSSNARIDVFANSGGFELAFGWGVQNGLSSFQTCTAATTCKAGVAGAAPSQFDRPASVAVDNDPSSSSHHAIYVAENRNHRVQKFTPNGSGVPEFALAFGSGEGEFSDTPIRATPLYVATGPGGIVYTADTVPINEEADLYGRRIQKFTPTGTPLGSPLIVFEGPLHLAIPVGLQVDAAGNIYIGSSTTIEKRDGAGASLLSLAVTNPQSLALSQAGNILVGGGEPGASLRTAVTEYANDGTPLRRFGFAELADSTVQGLAAFPNPNGKVYVAEGFFGASRVLDLDFPPPGPLILPGACSASPVGNIKATLNAQVDPEGKETTVAFEYVDLQSFETEGGFSSPNTQTSSPLEIGSGVFVKSVAIQVTGLEPETAYVCRAVATNADEPAGVRGEEGEFETREAVEFEPPFATDVDLDAATLNGEVNPLGIPTTAVFQYVDDATFKADVQQAEGEGKTPAEIEELGLGFSHAAQAPPGAEIDVGSSEELQLLSTSIEGLEPGVLYHFRIVAKDSFFPDGIGGPEGTFRTFSGSENLDSRAYELVSPTAKNNAEVAVPGARGGILDENSFSRIQAAASAGGAITFTSFTAFADPESAPGVAQYLSRRTSAGWSTESISPFGREGNPLRPPYRGFTADLGFGGVVVTEPPLTSDALPGFENLYLRNNQAESYRALTTEVQEGVSNEEFCTAFAGATPDGKHAIFAANAPLTPDAPSGTGFSLYEWSESKGLVLVSYLSNGTANPAVPAADTSFGSRSGGCAMGNNNQTNAISADGSRVFWTYAPPAPTASRLLVRINGTETIQVDANKGGTGPSGNGTFLGASVDGSQVFFSSSGRLTPASKTAAAGQPDLYVFDVDAKTLKDLTPLAGEPADVRGLVGISDDGSSAYFVAKGKLAPAATAGQPNLYLWKEGQIDFIATLSESDSAAWSLSPRSRTSRVTPDGTHLAFTSIQPLTGFDNTIAEGIHCQPAAEEALKGSPSCPEVFVYDAQGGELACVSCNPGGARPLGPATLPGSSNPFVPPHVLSDDGSRAFFSSLDALDPRDVNGKPDVYEYEEEGHGTCSSQSGSFEPASGGCLSLVSSGESGDTAYLLDASSTGQDVFFATRESLVGWDQDSNYDVYDYREGGGFPEPEPPAAPCADLGSCRPPAQAPPAAPSPATGSFVGQGNVKPKPHKKKHKKRHKKKHKKHSKAKQNGRNAR